MKRIETRDLIKNIKINIFLSFVCKTAFETNKWNKSQSVSQGFRAGISGAPESLDFENFNIL